MQTMPSLAISSRLYCLSTAADTSPQQAAVLTQHQGIWLVQQTFDEPIEESWKDPREESRPQRFLQIATGRWVSQKYATKFPGRSSAEAYAREYGLDLQHQITVVPASASA